LAASLHAVDDRYARLVTIAPVIAPMLHVLVKRMAGRMNMRSGVLA
jgi:hypothetical protein